MGTDPVFGGETPLVFAHRGGAGEVPESTEAAFRHAVKVGADVLEIDLQITRDGRIVVWHGPDLDNVRDVSRKRMRRKLIWDCRWKEDLEDKAFVVDPRRETKKKKGKKPAPRSQRKLMLLSRFVDLVDELQEDAVRPIHVNIELKLTRPPAPPWVQKGPADAASSLGKLFRQLKRLGRHEGRVVLVVAREVETIRAFRRKQRKAELACPTGLAVAEQKPFLRKGSLLAAIAARFPGPELGRMKSLRGKALQTWWRFHSRKLVESIHDRKGAVHLFLTGFAEIDLTAKDDDSFSELKEYLRKRKRDGVDGFMTDYPRKVLRALGRL